MILLVEDDPDDAMAVLIGFDQAAITENMYVASGAEQALKFLGAFPSPKLILVDLGLQGKSGLRLIREIHSNARWAHIPIVVLTGSAATQSLLDAIQREGAVAYIEKPLTATDFFALIQRIGLGWQVTGKLPGRQDGRGPMELS